MPRYADAQLDACIEAMRAVSSAVAVRSLIFAFIF
jgi:hypothetical protein